MTESMHHVLFDDEDEEDEENEESEESQQQKLRHRKGGWLCVYCKVIAYSKIATQHKMFEHVFQMSSFL